MKHTLQEWKEILRCRAIEELLANPPGLVDLTEAEYAEVKAFWSTDANDPVPGTSRGKDRPSNVEMERKTPEAEQTVSFAEGDAPVVQTRGRSCNLSGDKRRARSPSPPEHRHPPASSGLGNRGGKKLYRLPSIREWDVKQLQLKRLKVASSSRQLRSGRGFAEE